MIRRDRYEFEGIHANESTWAADATLVSAVLAAGGPTTAVGRAVAEGRAVTVTDDKTAGFGSAGDRLLGKVNHYHSDGAISVQDVGYASLPGVSGSLPIAGDVIVVDGDGAVMASTGATGKSIAISVESDDATGPVVVFIG